MASSDGARIFKALGLDVQSNFEAQKGSNIEPNIGPKPASAAKGRPEAAQRPLKGRSEASREPFGADVGAHLGFILKLIRLNFQLLGPRRPTSNKPTSLLAQ